MKQIFLNMSLSRPLLDFPHRFCYILIYFTFVNVDRKEERRVCTVLFHFIRKSPIPSDSRLTVVLN